MATATEGSGDEQDGGGRKARDALGDLMQSNGSGAGPAAKRPRMSLKLKAKKDAPSKPPRPFFQAQQAPRDAPSRSSTGPRGLAGLGREEAARQRGLANLGNTCYANAVLQALHHCSAFRSALRALPSTLDAAPSQGASITVARELGLLLDSLDEAPSITEPPPPASPVALLQALRQCVGLFEADIQHDAHEFLVSLLAVLADVPLPEGRQAQEVFVGRMGVETVCLQCEQGQARSEAFVDTSLPLPRAPLASLSWALSTHTACERLEGANRYRCSGCLALTEAERRMHFTQLPGVLALHLKRFAYAHTVGGLAGSKVCSSLPVPTTLCLAQWCAPACPQRTTTYELQAFVVHQGTAVSSGHYVAFIRSRGRWVLLDDDCAHFVAPSAVHGLLHSTEPTATTPYLLFYAPATPAS